MFQLPDRAPLHCDAQHRWLGTRLESLQGIYGRTPYNLAGTYIVLKQHDQLPLFLSAQPPCEKIWWDPLAFLQAPELPQTNVHETCTVWYCTETVSRPPIHPPLLAAALGGLMTKFAGLMSL